MIPFPARSSGWIRDTKSFLQISLFALVGQLFLAPDLPASVFLHVPEAAEENYQVLYEIDLPINAAFRRSTPVAYVQNNSDTIPDFDRVAYYLRLVDGNGTKWVYVSMDPFTSDPVELGLPHHRDNPIIHQRSVENMNVSSNVPGVVTGTFLDGGHLEMWPSNYSEGDDYGVFAASRSRFDWGDSGASTDEGYGSFQVHNVLARQTVFAWNRWGSSSAVDDDVGIGNQPTGEPDWTFAGNTANYSSRKLVILVRPRVADLELSEFPQNRQLYTRDTATNLATVPIHGEEFFGGFEKAILRIFRNGTLKSQLEQNLVYSDGRASFSFEPTIVAELAKYDFELWLDDGNEEKLLRRAREIVAGDAFLVYGQSNAEAYSWEPTRSANEYASQWILTFGQNGDSGDHAKNILLWVQAEGDGGRQDPGSIGQWPMVLAHEIVDSVGVPVAILNGSRSSYEIRRLYKDREDPDNLYDTTEDNVRRPYNRLRYRAIQAGVAETIRAIFYYQGENDNERPKRHSDGYQVLREDWAVDYPGVERFYCTQVRPGCGVTTENVALREAQRRLGDIYPNTFIMPSNGLESHDGCHFLFTDGYEELGLNYARVVLRDLYDGPDGPDIDPINPSIATFTDSSRTEIRLLLRNSATIDFPAGALADFHVTNTAGTITGAIVDGDSILFQLSAPAASNSLIEYRSHLGPGEWVTNANGVGMLSFSIPISQFNLTANGTELSGTDLNRIADGSEAATLTIQLRDENGNAIKNSGISIVFKTDLGTFPNGALVSDPILTDSNGIAQTTLVSQKSGTATITATAEGSTVLNGSPVSVNFVPGSYSVTENATFLHGENLSPTADGIDAAEAIVQLRDEWGNQVPLPDVAVTFQTNFGSFANNSSSISVSTDSDGRASAFLVSDLVGTAEITATVDEEAVISGSPLIVHFLPGPFDLGENGTRLSATNLTPAANGLETALIIVELRDASGNPIAESGVTVSFTTILGAFPNGNQTISVDTDENGLATTWLSSTTAGLATINASIGEIPVTNGSAEIEFQPGPATELSLDVDPVIERAGDLFTVQPVVSLRDAFGNIVSFDSETEIRVAIAAGDGGNLTGTTSLQVTGGVASFTDLTFGGIIGKTYQLEFAAPDTDLAPAFSEPFEILAGPVQLLVFLQQPSDTAIHQTIEPPLSVALQDRFGNLISNQSDSITVSLGENPGNADLTGTSTVETIDGIATFSDLKIDRIAEGYTLIATSAAELTAAESEPFAITAGPGYSVWAEALPEGLRGEDQDPGGFGIPNILRYAFDLDPLVPEYDKLPTILIVQDETGEWLSIQFQRRTDDPSLIYTVEAGDELDTFALLGNPILEVIDNQPPAETVVATDPRPISESNRRFLRVRLLGW